MYRNSSLQFYPNCKTLREFIMSIYDYIRFIVLNLDRLEHKLYKDYKYTAKILMVNTIFQNGNKL